MRGLQRMVDEDTYCIDVLTQISAATRRSRRSRRAARRSPQPLCGRRGRRGRRRRGGQGGRGLRGRRPPRPLVTSVHPIAALVVVDDVGSGLREGFFMFWETLWALVLGFGLSGAVQAFVSKDAMQRTLGDHRAGTIARASVFGMVVVELLLRGGGDDATLLARAPTSPPRWCSCSRRPTSWSSSGSCSSCCSAGSSRPRSWSAASS